MTSNNSMTFNQYMNQYEVPKGRKSTNTSMCYPKKSYHIPDDKYPEFLQKYAEQVEKGTDLHLTEKPSEYSPIRVDLDFRFEPAESSSKHLYSLQNIKNIITEYCKVIKDTFQCQEIISVLQEKEESTTFRGKVKDGVHIIFPYIHISYDLQHYIREQVLKSDLVQEEFKQMKVLNKYDDIIDKAVISSNNWFLYGSKKLECHAYRVSHTFKYDGVLQSTSIPDNYIQLFSMRNMNTDNNININQDKSDLIQEYIKSPENYITRLEFNPDFTIWMDTIPEGRFEDTNAMFEKPERSHIDYHVAEWFNDTHTQLMPVVKKWMEKNAV